jgi:hypothetical protein
MKNAGLIIKKQLQILARVRGYPLRILIENGNTVYAVEPNDDMRKAAEFIFRDSENFKSVNGTAESTALDNDFAI